MFPTEVVDARKQKIDADAAWDLLKDAHSLRVAKRQKVVVFDRVIDSKDEVLRQVMGPSGNLRAPTYRSGDEVIVGFNQGLYEQWLE
ncbi:MAG: hypothetical protein C0618_08265 [Desulfuromonas sp.]|nr:MAG: hypothetical protein C0618_08265 [Desulfuromonas sp.]